MLEWSAVASFSMWMSSLRHTHRWNFFLKYFYLLIYLLR